MTIKTHFKTPTTLAKKKDSLSNFEQTFRVRKSYVSQFARFDFYLYCMRYVKFDFEKSKIRIDIINGIEEIDGSLLNIRIVEEFYSIINTVELFNWKKV